MTKQTYTENGLVQLAAAARRDLARLNYPLSNWVLPATGPDGKTALDVLVVGAGMCGQTAAFALLREGVTNIRIVDRAPRGLEGPWGTFARMETLRSPKHLTGPDLGIPSLTFRAWFEAQHGESGWRELYKVGRLDWLAYLIWVRDVVGIPVENDTEVLRLFPAGALIGAEMIGPRGHETLYARNIVLACGREGSGGRRMPPFATESKRLFHASDPIDFTRFRGGRMAVLGASATAVDNAATALEAGVEEVALFVRRAHFPQVNKSKWASFPGFMRGYAALDDARSWAFYTYILGEGTPPPHESVLRCTRHPGFRIHFGESWTAVNDTADGIAIKTTKGSYAFHAAVIAIGFDVDLVQRQELAAFREYILTWGDRVAPEQAAAHPEAARFPYLGDGMQMLERQIGAMPTLGSLHVFNWGVTMSHGALAGDIPGLGIGATRLANAIVRELFVADADEYFIRMQAQEDDELKPTDFFVPRENR